MCLQKTGSFAVYWFGKCVGTMDGKATRKQILHALAVSCVQSRQFLQARCENNYLNKKIKTPFKKLRIYEPHVLNKCFPSTLCMVRSNLMRRFLQIIRMSFPTKKTCYSCLVSASGCRQKELASAGGGQCPGKSDRKRRETLFRKVIDFPAPSRDVTYKTLPGRE